MIGIDLNFIVSIVNKATNSKDILYLWDNPSLFLSEEQHLIAELIKSWGQAMCYELLNFFFTNEPLTPSLQDKKNKTFQNFMIVLFLPFTPRT